MKSYIYVLREIGDSEVRYVGQSAYPSNRLYSHVNEYKSGKTRRSHPICQWFDSISIVEMEVIEECKIEIAVEREDYWENYFQSNGHRLTNVGCAKVSPYRKYNNHGEIDSDFLFREMSCVFRKTIRVNRRVDFEIDNDVFEALSERALEMNKTPSGLFSEILHKELSRLKNE